MGDKLGRHPQLGRELGGIYGEEKALKMVDLFLDHYLKGERFGKILERTGMWEIRIDPK